MQDKKRSLWQTKRWALILLGGSLLILLMGCAPTTQSQLVEARMDWPFTLQPGQTAEIPDDRHQTKLQVTFVELVSDSRCPEDVVCVQAGEAVVKVEILDGAGNGGTVTLRTNPLGTVAATTGYVAELDDVQPYPNSQKERAIKDYTITLVIARIEDAPLPITPQSSTP